MARRKWSQEDRGVEVFYFPVPEGDSPKVDLFTQARSAEVLYHMPAKTIKPSPVTYLEGTSGGWHKIINARGKLQAVHENRLSRSKTPPGGSKEN